MAAPCARRPERSESRRTGLGDGARQQLEPLRRARRPRRQAPIVRRRPPAAWSCRRATRRRRGCAHRDGPRRTRRPAARLRPARRTAPVCGERRQQGIPGGDDQARRREARRACVSTPCAASARDQRRRVVLSAVGAQRERGRLVVETRPRRRGFVQPMAGEPTRASHRGCESADRQKFAPAGHRRAGAAGRPFARDAAKEALTKPAALPLPAFPRQLALHRQRPPTPARGRDAAAGRC